MSRNLKWLRLSLGGAVLGMAVANSLGVNTVLPDDWGQWAGAGMGAALAAILVKVAHVI